MVWKKVRWNDARNDSAAPRVQSNASSQNKGRGGGGGGELTANKLQPQDSWENLRAGKDAVMENEV